VISPPTDDRWFSVEEIAAYLGVQRDTVYKWIIRKNLPAHKVGRLWKFQKSEIDNWVRAGANATAGGIQPPEKLREPDR
jgi:excisionase family DNA binding protein